jgi:hypothetical protein
LCEDPDLQREYQARARNGSDPTPTGVLSESQRRSYTARTNDLKRQREEIVREWLNEGATSQNLNPRYLQESVEHIDAEITRLERQLELSNRLLASQGGHNGITHRSELLERAREILTPEPPDDPALRQRRMIFVQQALSKVVARRTDSGFEIELQGPLIPADATPLHFDPLAHAPRHCRGQLTWKSTLGSQFPCGADVGLLGVQCRFASAVRQPIRDSISRYVSPRARRSADPDPAKVGVKSGSPLSLDPPRFLAVSSGAEGRMTSWAGLFQDVSASGARAGGHLRGAR